MSKTIISRGGRQTHGHSFRGRVTPTYVTWCAMMTRCYNTNRETYHLYGGRGIIVCERWHSFENFLADMGERPSGMTIDRIDNNGIYRPENCRWANHSTQTRNSRKATLLTFLGRTQSLVAWADEIGVSPKTLSSRLNYCGMTVEQALTTKKNAKPNTKKERLLTYQGRTQRLVDWAREYGISPKTLSARINKCNMSVEDALTRGRHQKRPSESAHLAPSHLQDAAAKIPAPGRPKLKAVK